MSEAGKARALSVLPTGTWNPGTNNEEAPTDNEKDGDDGGEKVESSVGEQQEEAILNAISDALNTTEDAITVGNNITAHDGDISGMTRDSNVVSAARGNVVTNSYIHRLDEYAIILRSSNAMEMRRLQCMKAQRARATTYGSKRKLGQKGDAVEEEEEIEKDSHAEIVAAVQHAGLGVTSYKIHSAAYRNTRNESLLLVTATHGRLVTEHGLDVLNSWLNGGGHIPSMQTFMSRVSSKNGGVSSAMHEFSAADRIRLIHRILTHIQVS